MATPLTEPSPGIAPTNNPTTTPNKARPRLIGCNATRMPSNSDANTSILCLLQLANGHRQARSSVSEKLKKNIVKRDEQWFEISLRQDDPHRNVEKEKADYRYEYSNRHCELERVTPQKP